MKEKIFDLPCFDRRKSFYGKAKIIEQANGEKLLRSYETIVCKIDKNGNFVRMWDGYSATTMRHINSFLSFYGIPNEGKAYWKSLQVQKYRKEAGNMLTNSESISAMYARRRMSREHATNIPDFKKSREYHQMRMIVYSQGGFREKDILSNPHFIEKSETWNDEHKVLNVLGAESQNDGHRNGFAVDLVTMSICG